MSWRKTLTDKGWKDAYVPGAGRSKEEPRVQNGYPERTKQSNTRTMDFIIPPAKRHKPPLQNKNRTGAGTKLPPSVAERTPVAGVLVSGSTVERRRHAGSSGAGGARIHPSRVHPSGVGLLRSRSNTVHAPRTGVVTGNGPYHSRREYQASDARRFGDEVTVHKPAEDHESPLRRTIDFDEDADAETDDFGQERSPGCESPGADFLRETDKFPDSQVSPASSGGVETSRTPGREPLRSNGRVLRGSDITGRSPKNLRELYSAAREEIRRLQKGIDAAQDALQLGKERQLDLNRKLTEAQDKLKVEKHKQCPGCHYKVPASGRSRTRGPGQGGKAEKRPTRRSALNDALEAAIEIDAENQYSGKPVILTSALHSALASTLAAPIVNQLEYTRIRADAAHVNENSSRRSRPAPTRVLQHRWLPKLQKLRLGQGTPVFKSSGTVEENNVTVMPESQGNEGDEVGFVPKIPLELAVRPVDGGGMIATPGVFGAHRGDDQFQCFTAEFCKIVMRSDPTCSSFTDEEIAGLANLNQSHRPTQKQVRSLHLRRLSTVKNILISNVLKVLGFGNAAVFGKFFAPAVGAWKSDQDNLKKVLGIGGDANERKLPATYAAWTGAPDHSLKKWRTLSQSDIENVRAIVKRFRESYYSRNPVGQEDDCLSSQSSARSLQVSGPDIFFGSEQLRYVFSVWMGRVAETVVGPTSEHGNDGRDVDLVPRAVRGDTSLLTLARADAYVSAWFALNVRASESRVSIASGDYTRGVTGSIAPIGSSRKRDVPPVLYNRLCQELLPYAAVGLLKECRDEFERLETQNMIPKDPDISSGTDESTISQWDLESRVPFSMRALTQVCVQLRVERPKLGTLRTSTVEEDKQRWDEVRAAIDSHPETRVAIGHHDLDFFMERARKNTLHFHDAEDSADYLALKAEYVRRHICSWIGDVRDAFIGRLDDKTGYFEPISLSMARPFRTNGDQSPISDIGQHDDDDEQDDD